MLRTTAKTQTVNKFIKSDTNNSCKKQISKKCNTIMNKGEYGEICVVKKIYNLSKNNDIVALKSIFGDDADNGLLIYDINTNDEITNESMIKKAPSRSKADIKIKFKKNNMCIYCSIKCHHGATPTILNHTPRSAQIFQNGDLFLELPNLDKLILILNNERSSGNTGEDIYIKNIIIDENCKVSLINTICYFLFTGTGSGKSKYPADSIIEIHDPSDIKKYKYYNCINNEDRIKYVKYIYDRIIISMRNKGMPSNKNILCCPWIFIQKDVNNIIKEKGSLHIRLKK